MSATFNCDAESSTEVRKRWTSREMNVSEPGPVDLEDIILDESRLDKEVALLVSRYLASRSYGHIAKIIEEQVLERSGAGSEDEMREVEQVIQNGDFGTLETLIARPGLLKPQSQKAFMYLCYRQRFLEHVENRESQKAFNLLSKRLKPLEHYQPIPYDFYSLSYLTSASTVHDAPSFRDWAGPEAERENLVRRWRELIDAERDREVGNMTIDAVKGGNGHADVEASRMEEPLARAYTVPDGRLVELLKQAGAWQVGQIRRTGKGKWKIGSLLKDYQPLCLPTVLADSLNLHIGGIKCVAPLAPNGETFVTGGSDCVLKVISVTDSTSICTLQGHTSRVWDVDTSGRGDLIASASGDGSVKLWSAKGDSLETLANGGGDVYGVRFRPYSSSRSTFGGSDGPSSGVTQVSTASYDRIIRTFDIITGTLVRTFSGHALSALCLTYDSAGTLMASGSKDRQVRLWDAVGGVCVNTISGCLGEVTSVEFDHYGRYLLVGSKDNSNRLWDLRMQRNLYRYAGHQNTTKNFIRCSFAQEGSMVISGSEDGHVYMWEREPSLTDGANTGSMGLGMTPHSSSSGLNVKPHTIFEADEANDHGAVFDVKMRGGAMVCAWEDGYAGIWECEDER